MNTLNQKSTRNLLYVASALLFVVIVVAAIAIISLSGNQSDTTSADTVTRTNSPGEVVNQTLTDFSFVSNSGDELRLSELQGSYVLLSFGYTHCPDVCPATMLTFKRVKTILGESADNLEFVFVSVDGQRDTPQVLDRYLNRYDSAFIGLSGDSEGLNTIQDEYGLFYELRENPNTQAGYLVDHTASKYLIDPQGNLIRIYSFAVSASEIAAEIQSLL